MSRKTRVDVLAMTALQGRLAKLPKGISPEEILEQFPNMGGMNLPDSPANIVKKALRFTDGGRVSHIIVNTLDKDIHVGLLIDTPDHPATEESIADRRGFLTYVYVPTFPHFSELGYCCFEKKSDEYFHRIR